MSLKKRVKLEKVRFNLGTEWVDQKEIERDPSNPNEMTPEQREGLRHSIETFGYVSPIFTDQNLKVADGEQRLDELVNHYGIKKIPIIRLDFKNDAERRLFRQTMNKLRGQHDLLRDVEEIKIIKEGGFFDSLVKIIGEKEATMLLEGGSDNLLGVEETPADRFQLTLYLPIERKEEVEGFISDQKKSNKFETAGDVFLLLMERYNESSS